MPWNWKARSKHSVEHGGSVGTVSEAVTPGTWPSYEAAYLANRLGSHNPTSAYYDKYIGDKDIDGVQGKSVFEGMNTAGEVAYLQKVTEDYKQEAEETLRDEFKQWLQGTHEDNVAQRVYPNRPGQAKRRFLYDENQLLYNDGRRGDGYPGSEMSNWRPTWWGQAQLTHLPGVREFLREGEAASEENSFAMNMLAEHGPQNLEQAWAYFKHWVKGRPLSDALPLHRHFELDDNVRRAPLMDIPPEWSSKGPNVNDGDTFDPSDDDFQEFKALFNASLKSLMEIEKYNDNGNFVSHYHNHLNTNYNQFMLATNYNDKRNVMNIMSRLHREIKRKEHEVMGEAEVPEAPSEGVSTQLALVDGQMAEAVTHMAEVNQNLAVGGANLNTVAAAVNAGADVAVSTLGYVGRRAINAFHTGTQFATLTRDQMGKAGQTIQYIYNQFPSRDDPTVEKLNRSWNTLLTTTVDVILATGVAAPLEVLASLVTRKALTGKAQPTSQTPTPAAPKPNLTRAEIDQLESIRGENPTQLEHAYFEYMKRAHKLSADNVPRAREEIEQFFRENPDVNEAFFAFPGGSWAGATRDPGIIKGLRKGRARGKIRPLNYMDVNADSVAQLQAHFGSGSQDDSTFISR